MSKQPVQDNQTLTKFAKLRHQRITVNQAWAGEANCLQCALRTSVLFTGLQQSDFEHIHGKITQITLAPNELLYRIGDPVHSLFTVHKGLVKHLRLLPDGTQRVLRLASKSDVLGLEALVLNTYQNDAIALNYAEVCAIPAKMVHQLAVDNPILHQNLMQHWQKALNAADTWILDLSTGSARARVARLLLRLASIEDNSKCELVSREDMGAMLGITTETASRTVAEFKRKKLVRDTAFNECSLDVDGLRRIATD